MIRAWVSELNWVVCVCSLFSACWVSAGRQDACAADPVLRLQTAETRAEIAFLSWDTEGGDRAETNLLRSGQGVTSRVRVSGQWLSAAALPTRVEHPTPSSTVFLIAVGTDAELSWSLTSTVNSLTMSIVSRGPQAATIEAIQVIFPFDPGITPTTVLPCQWEDDGILRLPAVISAPDFGQMLLTDPDRRGWQGRLEGSRAEKTVDFIAQLASVSPGETCSLVLTSLQLPAPEGLSDVSLWQQARRGWFGAWQPSARWGDQSRPFSAPPGILANNVISDPASCSLWFYADQALWTPRIATDVSIAHLVRRSVDWWLLERTRPSGEVVCYWDYGNFLDANAGPLIAAWDYVEATGDTQWLAQRIERCELIADFLAARDVDNDGMVEAVQSGNRGTLKQPARSCAWFDALNCGHKDGYTNALIYRAWRCLAELEGRLGRREQSARYEALADRLQASYATTLFNPATGWLAWWKSEDGELHDYATPIVNGLAIEYGLVAPDQGREILARLWEKIDAVGFTRFDLGVPPMLIPVRRDDYLLPDGLGIPQREDGTDTLGHYQNGGITAGQVLHFLAAHYVVGQPEKADKVLRAMLQRQAQGKFQNGVRDAGGQGIDWTDWQGNATGYEGYLADSFRFLQAVLLREESFRARLYRPLALGAASRDTSNPPPESAQPTEHLRDSATREVPAWLSFVPEMQTVPIMNRAEPSTPWSDEHSAQYADDLSRARDEWRRLAPTIETHVTPPQVRSLSRWALPQMEQYGRVPDIASAELKPLRIDAEDHHILFEATLDTLPTHSSLVTRWLKAIVLYDRPHRSITRVTITIRGERLE
jgi:hypothetical protein